MSQDTEITLSVGNTKIELTTGSRRMAEHCGITEFYQDNKRTGRAALDYVHDHIIKQLNPLDASLLLSLSVRGWEYVESEEHDVKEYGHAPIESLVSLNIRRTD